MLLRVIAAKNTQWCFKTNGISIYGNKVYTNFRNLNEPDDCVECESFTVISIDSLIVYENKYYLQVYLDC